MKELSEILTIKYIDGFVAIINDTSIQGRQKQIHPILS